MDIILVCSTTHKLLHTINSLNICLMSLQRDHLLPCPSCINLSGDPLPPVTNANTHTHTYCLSSTWIMHIQAVGSELMSQLLSEHGETDTGALWWLYQPVLLLRLYSAPDVQGAGWWIMGHPSRPCSAVSPHRRQEHVVWRMWLCVCVSVFAQGWRTICVCILLKGWNHLTAILYLCLGLMLFPFSTET